MVLKRLEAYSVPEDNLINDLIFDFESDSKKLLNLLSQQLSKNDVLGIQVLQPLYW